MRMTHTHAHEEHLPLKSGFFLCLLPLRVLLFAVGVSGASRVQTDVNRKNVRVVQPTLCEASSQAPEAHVQQSGESVRRCLRQEGQQHLKSFCRPDGRSPAEEPLREAFPQKRAASNLRPRPPSVASAVMAQESYPGHARRCSVLHGARLHLRRLFQLTYQCCSERMLRMKVETTEIRKSD